jgi:hypothetical protein
LIEVAELAPGGEECWKEFLEGSNNGTLFHDLGFLAYHPPERFRTRHLILSESGRTVALLPAALAEGAGGAVLRSPYGASVGGLVLPVGQPAGETRRVVRALRDYAAENGFQGIEMRLGPAAYLRESHDHLAFALFAEGFRLAARHLCHIVALPAAADRSKARDCRMGARRGLVAGEAGPGRLSDFYRVLAASQARHRAVPTHTEAELADLFRRVPGRLRLFLCGKEGLAAAGILVFALNAQVAYTFYIARGEAFKTLCPAAVLLTHVARQMAGEGFRFLDLGPSTFDDLSFNPGVAAFKEDFGAVGHCRDTWRWERG